MKPSHFKLYNGEILKVDEVASYDSYDNSWRVINYQKGHDIWVFTKDKRYFAIFTIMNNRINNEIYRDKAIKIDDEYIYLDYDSIMG